MLFSEKYPKANYDNEYENHNYIYGKPDNCYMCGRITNFIEKNTGAHICSEDCDEKFYSEMFKAEMKKYEK